MTATRSSRQVPVSRGALWFALLGGGIAWAVHLGGAWAISEFGCISGADHRLLVGGLVGVSVVTFGAALGATAVGWRGEKRLELEDPAERVPGPAMYMARAGWITSAVFAFIILVQSIPIFFYLRDC